MALNDLNRLKQIAIFCQVVDRGSMRGAAEDLAMTPPAVSQHIKQLEQALGVSLMLRSTRKLNLTEAGESYYQHGKRMLAAAGDADDAIHEVKTSLEGELRISAPVGLASRPLAKALRDILKDNPYLQLTVLASDQEINLGNEQIDIALRAGTPKESSFIFYPLGQATKHIFASPDYLKRMGTPVLPSDLPAHQWLGTINKSELSTIELSHPSQSSYRYNPEFILRVDNLNVLTGHVLEGVGMSVLPELEIQHLIDAGELIKVLPDWKMSSIPLYALTMDRQQSYKVKAVLKALQTFFSKTAHLD